MRAWLNLRYTNDSRARMFERGLKRVGFKPEHGIPANPGKKDIFITWNRIGAGNTTAKLFESSGLPVLVVENASWGNRFGGENWYHIARNYHNTVGMFDFVDCARWDDLNQPLLDWRRGGETVILPQRGIGSDPVRMPKWFLKKATDEHGGRIRRHPGRNERIALEDDLANCGMVITWGSGAAIKAIAMGIPCLSYMPDWIGHQYNTDKSRLEMFRRLAWAQWRHQEIKSGLAFDCLLNNARDESKRKLAGS